jgi:hypothetical protein
MKKLMNYQLDRISIFDEVGRAIILTYCDNRQFTQTIDVVKLVQKSRQRR